MKPDELLAARSPEFWRQIIERRGFAVSGRGCWILNGSANSAGYMVLKVRMDDGSRVALQAHRVSHTGWIGAIPDGLAVDHLCRVRTCVNPAHLEAVTSRVNYLRGAAPSAVAWRTDQCASGRHALAGDNVIHQNGARACRACRREWERTRRVRPSRRRKAA